MTGPRIDRDLTALQRFVGELNGLCAWIVGRLWPPPEADVDPRVALVAADVWRSRRKRHAKEHAARLAQYAEKWSTAAVIDDRAQQERRPVLAWTRHA